MSQRLIHTRVYGQAIAVGATVAVMAILKAQEDRGGLPFGETAPQADTSNTLPGTLSRRFRVASFCQFHGHSAWGAIYSIPAPSLL